MTKNGTKQFALLGVYAGELAEQYEDEDGNTDQGPYLDSAIVWYAELIEEIIALETPWDPTAQPTIELGADRRRPRRRKL